MASRKRVIFSEADAHRLMDIISNYGGVVECKRTDATTWKQKDEAWKKITNIYNATTTEPRTSEQLRCKFDNLKKEVRKYYAKQKQNQYKTGGGIANDNIKAITKALYEKIKSIIGFSIEGMQPNVGDSDAVTEEHKELQNQTDNSSITGEEEESFEQEEIHSSSVPVNAATASETFINVLEIVDEKENHPDWSDYTPRMIRKPKHKSLQVKRKSQLENTESSENNLNDIKLLKQQLLLKEDARLEEFHKFRMEREKLLYDEKELNKKLQNEKLRLEMELLRQSKTHNCK